MNQTGIAILKFFIFFGFKNRILTENLKRGRGAPKGRWSTSEGPLVHFSPNDVCYFRLCKEPNQPLYPHTCNKIQTSKIFRKTKPVQTNTRTNEVNNLFQNWSNHRWWCLFFAKLHSSTSNFSRFNNEKFQRFHKKALFVKVCFCAILVAKLSYSPKGLKSK